MSDGGSSDNLADALESLSDGERRKREEPIDSPGSDAEGAPGQEGAGPAAADGHPREAGLEATPPGGPATDGETAEAGADDPEGADREHAAPEGSEPGGIDPLAAEPEGVDPMAAAAEEGGDPFQRASDEPVELGEGFSVPGRPASERLASTDPDQMRKLGVALLVGLGVALLIPALWSAGWLIGMEVPGAQRDSARGMALLMLSAWPISLLLFGAAGLTAWQIRNRDGGEAARPGGTGGLDRGRPAENSSVD